MAKKKKTVKKVSKKTVKKAPKKLAKNLKPTRMAKVQEKKSLPADFKNPHVDYRMIAGALLITDYNKLTSFISPPPQHWAYKSKGQAQFGHNLLVEMLQYHALPWYKKLWRKAPNIKLLREWRKK